MDGERMNTETMFSSKDQTWETPKDFFKKLDDEFHFTLDPCCSKETAKCGKFYTEKENGLVQDWQGETVFINPPYGREISKWVQKSYEESKKENTLCVMLIPARTDTKWFHEYIYHNAEIRFLKGRLKFGNATNSAPFPSMIVIFGAEQ